MTQLVLPVDAIGRDQVKEIIARTKGLVDYYKFGSIPFTAIGPELIAWGHAAGAKVFVDLKYHDIPNTVAGAAEACVGWGVDMFNVHVGGGKEMLLRTMERVRTTCAERKANPPLVMGVTVLTSMNEAGWAETYSIAPRPILDQVLHFARLAKECGLDGVVASAQEVETIKQECGGEFLVLTPGIRLPAEGEGRKVKFIPHPFSLLPVSGDDQARTMTPGEAARRGADFIVVGRPITQAPDPAAVCARIREDIRAAAAEAHR
jgi:orotidine-5'-phosphate decarboxylase